MPKKSKYVDLVDSEDSDLEDKDAEEYFQSSDDDDDEEYDGLMNDDRKAKCNTALVQSVKAVRKSKRYASKKNDKQNVVVDADYHDDCIEDDESGDEEMLKPLRERLGKNRKRKSIPCDESGHTSTSISRVQKKSKTALKSVGNTIFSSTKTSTFINKTQKKKADSSTTKNTLSTKYLKSLKDSVKKRTFPLSQVPNNETINTGRTIKALKSWKGHWPALREFLQNTIDHLSLMDGQTGRRRECLDMNVRTNDNDDENHLATITFTCQTEVICKMIIATHEVIIDQSYTYPIASRALDTGVPDSTKSSSSSQAGGFGDGFKTAAVALIANSKKNEFQSLKWNFYAMKERTKIEWSFVGLTRESVATFSKCQVLQVKIDKKKMNSSDITDFLGNDAGSNNNGGRDYIMRQSIKVKGIGKSFLNEAIPRFVVFWDLNEESLISMTKRSPRSCGGDFLGPVFSQFPLFNGEINNSLKPSSGVYVKGIYVRATKIKDTIMSFYGNRLDVSGRDRNEVDEDELIDAVTELIGHCNNLPYLSELLSPLKGSMDLNDSSISPLTSKKSQRDLSSKKSGTVINSSWLLQSPRFFNRVVEIQKVFILCNVFRIPRGAICVSKKTTDSKDPFINWAATFLRQNGAPLVPIAKGANKILFEEVDRYDLTERCVMILKQNEKDRAKLKVSNNDAQTIFRKFFTFLGIGRSKVFFSPDVHVAFVHNSFIFIPESTLTRDLVVKVLNVCHSQIEGSSGENYSSLLQAIFEVISPSKKTIELTDATKLIDQAKKVLKDTKNFLFKSSEENNNLDVSRKAKDDVVSKSNEGVVGTANKGVVSTSNNIVILDSDSDDDEINDSSEKTSSATSQQMVPTTIADIEDQIIKKARQREISNSFIPESAFQGDNAGNDPSLRPSSSLVRVDVSASLGDGFVWFDATNASQYQNNTFSPNAIKSMKSLKKVVEEAKSIIQKSIPPTKTLLRRVMIGYDAKNDDYEGFCDGQNIILNFYSYLSKLPPSRTLIHDFIITITHELAHFLEPEAGHGPVWRDTHMKMVMRVMTYLEKK